MLIALEVVWLDSTKERETGWNDAWGTAISSIPVMSTAIVSGFGVKFPSEVYISNPLKYGLLEYRLLSNLDAELFRGIGAFVLDCKILPNGNELLVFLA